MSNRATWPPVYPDLNKSDDLARLAQPKVSARDAKLIVSVVGNDTILTYICQLAIKSAADYVRANNLSLADEDRFLRFLRERSASSYSPTETRSSDVSGRITGGSEQTPNSSDESALARAGTPRGGGERKGQIRKACGKK